MQFSPLIIGTMRWGSWGANFNLSEVQTLIQTALSEGLTTFDHADIYGNYTTENLFGEAFGKMGIDRSNVQFISKCGIELPSDNRPYTIKAYNYSKQHIIESVNNSLRNLKTDYLDLLLLHRPSPLLDPAEVADAFNELLQEKKVRLFGVSNFSTVQFEALNAFFPLVTNQVEISINQTKSFYDGTLDQLIGRKLRPMAYSVMGNYFTDKSEQNLRIKNVLSTLKNKYGAEENQLLIAFLTKHPAGIYPVVGTSRAETLRQLREGLNLQLDYEDWFRILEASAGKEVD